MNKLLFANNARGTLKVAITALDTALQLETGEGASFPDPVPGEAFRVTLVDASGNIEIVEVTDRNGDNFAVMERHKESTTPHAFAVGSRISMRVTKETLEGFRDSWLSGDYRLTLRTAAASGWVMCDDGTIGDSASGATYDADDAVRLFEVLWNIGEAICPVTPAGHGASAAADWAAHKKVALTKLLGRALAIAGAGAGLTARNLGSSDGVEDAVVVQHNHAVTDPGHDHDTGSAFSGGGVNSAAAGAIGFSTTTTTDVTGLTVNNAGVSGVGKNVPPSTFMNVELKL